MIKFYCTRTRRKTLSIFTTTYSTCNELL